MGTDFSVEAPALLAAAKMVAKALDPRKVGQTAVLVASQDGVQLLAVTPQMCMSVPVQGSLTVTTPGSVRGPLQHIFTKLAGSQEAVHLHAVTEVSEPDRLALLPALAEPGTRLTLLDKGSQWEEVTSQVLARREQTTLLPCEALKLVTRQVAYAAESDPRGHPPLSGVVLTLGDGQLTATATDVFRLAHASVSCPAFLAAPVVLAPAVLRAVLRVFAHSETLHLTATILTEQVIAQDNRPLLDAQPRERIVRLNVRDAAAPAAAAPTVTVDLVPIYGSYPDVTKALVPNRTEGREVMVRRAALRAALGTLISSLGKAWRLERITLQITDVMLHLQAGSTVIDLPLLPDASTKSGEPVSITLRADKLCELLDALHAVRRISSDELILHCTKLALHAAPCSTSDGLNVHHVLMTALHSWELPDRPR